jgi:hypothetical protein
MAYCTVYDSCMLHARTSAHNIFRLESKSCRSVGTHSIVVVVVVYATSASLFLFIYIFSFSEGSSNL